MNAFVEEWSKFDPEGTYFIKVADLPSLIRKLLKNQTAKSLLVERNRLREAFAIDVKSRKFPFKNSKFAFDAMTMDGRKYLE